MEIIIRILYRLVGNFLGVVFVLTCTISCSKKNIKFESVNKDEYRRDSILIDYTLREWLYQMHSGYYNLSDYFDPTKPTSKFEILIDTILYSPDKRKLFSVIIYKHDTSSLSSYDLASEYILKNLKSNYVYDGRTIVGFRDSINCIWTLHDFQPYIPLMFFTKETLKKEIYDFYTHKIKDRYLCSNKKGSVKYKYGIFESSFWEKSVIWKKGFVIKNKYLFELYSNDSIIPMEDFNVNYPDSILNLYR